MATAQPRQDAHVIWGWNRFFEEMSAFVRDADRRAADANFSYCEYVLDRLDVCIESLSSLVLLLRSRPLSVTSEDTFVAEEYSGLLSVLLRYLRGLYEQWDTYQNRASTSSASFAFSAPLFHSSLRGRPKFVISKEQIQYLRSMSFSWVHIAKLLGVSYMTVYRRRQEYGLPSSEGAMISDDHLSELLRGLRQELPSLGQTLVWGRVRSMGFKVTRARVRQVMRQNDPINTALRWRGEFVQRRPYSVAGPNSLWHLGENSC